MSQHGSPNLKVDGERLKSNHSNTKLDETMLCDLVPVKMSLSDFISK